MSYIIKIAFVLFNSFFTVYSSYCGQAAIPYSFQVLPDGQLLLGCARPTCFGWNANGEVAGDSPKFFRINKRNDGFLRDGDSEKKNFAKYDFYKTQTSICEMNYSSTSCNKPNQWVGGISPTSNTDQFRMKCCVYNGLQLATDRGSAEVAVGQIMIGGEVSKKKRQYAFDYIANIQKLVNEDGLITYNVTMKRMPCLSPLIEPKIEVEERVFSFVNSMNGWNKTGTQNPPGKSKNVVTKQKDSEQVQKPKKQKQQKEQQKTEKDNKIDLEKLEDEKIMKLLEAERIEQKGKEKQPVQSANNANNAETEQQNASPTTQATAAPEQSGNPQNQIRPAQGPHIPPPLGIPELPKPSTTPKLNGIPAPNLLQPQQPQMLQPPSLFGFNPSTLNTQLMLPNLQQPTYSYAVQQMSQQLQQPTSVQYTQSQTQTQMTDGKQAQQIQLITPQEQKYSEHQFIRPQYPPPQQQQAATAQPPMYTLPTLSPVQGILPLLSWGR